MDALYIYKHSTHDDFEIRHSLRSLALHMPYVRKVWIFGDRPKFLTDDTSLIEHVPHQATARVLNIKIPVTNFFLLMFLSSLIPDLSSEYVFFSDDFYLLKDFPVEEARKDRFLEDMRLNKFRGKGLWVDALWHTYDALIRLGYPGFNFETHTPTYLTRKRVMDAFCDLKDFTCEDRWWGMLGPTAILNHAHRHGRLNMTNVIVDNNRSGFWGKPPSYEEVVKQSEGKLYFNFDDPAFGDAIERYLTERFSEPCKYERA